MCNSTVVIILLTKHISSGTRQLSSSTGQLLEEEDEIKIQETVPTIDPLTGDWILSEWDILCLSVGCAILGCGGGGNTYSATVMALRAVRQGKKIRIVKPDV